MRRFLLWLFPTLIVIVTAWTVGPSLVDSCRAWVANQRLRRSVDNAVRSTSYSVSPDRWIRFQLPPQTVALRILTNAAVTQPKLPPDHPDRPRRGWRYSVEYQLFDEKGAVAEPKEYHLRTKITQYVDPETGKVQGVTWFRDSDRIPTQTRTIQLPLASVDRRPKFIRMRLRSSDSEVAEVVARVYIKYERSNYEQPYVWSRLPTWRRERLSRASVYPADLLSPMERRNLLRWNWDAIPPMGRVDVDYVQRQMYQQEDPQPDAADFLAPENGIACRPKQPITLPAPDEAGDVQLEFVPDRSVVAPESATVDIKYFQPIHGLVWKRSYTLDQLAEPLRLSTTGGLYEIVASDFVICCATWRQHGGKRYETRLVAQPSDSPSTTTTWDSPEIAEDAGEELPAQDAALDSIATNSTAPNWLESSKRFMRLHLADHDGRLKYSIQHVSGMPAPFRVSVRRLVMPPTDLSSATIGPDDQNAQEGFDPPEEVQSARLQYEWLDADGKSLKRGVVQTDTAVSKYDQATLGPVTLACTEPKAYFFSLPPEVAAIRFAADSDVAVASFTRPPDFPRTFRLPETRSPYQQLNELSRTWFLVRPDDYERRIMANQYCSLRTQLRPPEENVQLVTGTYDWSDTAPVANVPGRFVLTQRDPSLTIREEARHNVYHEFEANELVQLHWAPEDERSAVTPRLVYQLRQSPKHPVRVYLDGKLFHEFVPRALVGEVELPCIEQGIEIDKSHTVRIVTADSNDRPRLGQPKFWIRGAEIQGAAQHIKRFAYKLTGQSMVFPVVKYTSGREEVIVRPFFAQATDSLDGESASDRDTTDSRQRLNVRLIGTPRRQQGPLLTWTLTERLFEIRTDPSETALVFPGTVHVVDQGQRCIIVLGDDLPAGEYQLKLRWQSPYPDDAPAYVSVYRLLPETQSKRKMSVDSWIVATHGESK